MRKHPAELAARTVAFGKEVVRPGAVRVVHVRPQAIPGCADPAVGRPAGVEPRHPVVNGVAVIRRRDEPAISGVEPIARISGLPPGRTAERFFNDKATTCDCGLLALSTSPTVSANNRDGLAGPWADFNFAPSGTGSVPTTAARSSVMDETIVPVGRSNHSLPMIPCRFGEQPVSREAWPHAVRVLAYG